MQALLRVPAFPFRVGLVTAWLTSPPTTFFRIMQLRTFSLQTIDSQLVTSNCFIRSGLHGAIVSGLVNLRNDEGVLGLSSGNALCFVLTTGNCQLVYPPPPVSRKILKIKGN